MPKYMVCRVDAVERTIRSSEHFPCIVDTGDEERDPEDVVRLVFAPEEYKPGGSRSYYVMPMQSAYRVNFKPKSQFEVTVETFDAPKKRRDPSFY